MKPKEIRKEMAITQEEMAGRMGVHKMTWVKWESEERTPNNAAVRLMHLLLWLHWHKEKRAGEVLRLLEKKLEGKL